MPQAAPIFVSHTHEDNAWCRDFVAGLRKAGADVWYDEHDMGYGGLYGEINRQLLARPIFVVILSPRSVASKWVEREINAAISMQDEDPQSERIFLPVVAEKCVIPPLLRGEQRVSGPGDTGIAPAQAAARVIHALGLTPAGAAPATPPPAPAETASQAWERGKGLRAQGRFEEALAAYERAVALAPQKATYWTSKGLALYHLKRYRDALMAHEQALKLDPRLAAVWNNKGIALDTLQRYEEALAAYEQALGLDPKLAVAWNNKFSLLDRLGRKAEADKARKQRDAALK